jgi:hypothetical protein
VGCGGCGCGDSSTSSYSVTLDGGLPSTIDAGGNATGDAGDDGGATADAGAPYVGQVLSQEECNLVCHGGAVSCSVATVTPALTVQCIPGCLGREPEGLSERTRRVSSLGQYFAEMARIEAASVHAFRRMAHELSANGAPAALVRAARRAARDEIAHARMAGRMARRFGSEPGRPIIEPSIRRSLFALALENEIEGCARETLGTLTGMFQARFAEDAHIRAMMTVIANDEARHAALSHRVSAWARRRLTPMQSHALDVARDDAFAEAQSEFLHAPLAPWQRALGLPSAHASQALLDALQARDARSAA